MKTSFLFQVVLVSFLSVSIFSQQVPPATSGAEVTLHVALTDERANYVTGFNKDMFAVTSGKEPLEITSFNQDEAAEVVILLDRSDFISNYYRSKGGKRSSFYEMMSLFLQSANAANGYSVYAFNRTPQPLLDSTNDKNAVLSAIENLEALKLDKPKAIYDDCYFGIEKLSQSSRKKRVLLVFTKAAVDSESKHTAKQLREAAKMSNVLIYTVAVGEPVSIADQINKTSEAREQMAAIDTLGEVTPSTGGRSFFPRSSQEMALIFARLGEELRGQYTLSLKFKNTAATNKWQRIKVKVNPPKGTPRLVVRNQEEFFVK